MNPVPNEFPSRSSQYRIAFIGEALGQDEVRLRRPFVGSAGKLLDAHLSAAGISRAECFVGNLCQHQPPGNQLAAWAWSDPRIQDGIALLLADLRAFQPYLIVTLGNWPLHLFKHGNVAPARTKAGNVTFESKVGVWRGSLFPSHETLWLSNADSTRAPTHGPVPPRGPDGTGGELALTTPSTHYPQLPSSQGVRLACAADTAQAGPLASYTSGLADVRSDDPGVRYPSSCASGGGVSLDGAPLRFKCLATLHPAFVLRAWHNGTDLRQDLRKAREEGRTPVLDLPVVETVYGPSL